MAHHSQLPCDRHGRVCMSCRATPSDEEKLSCKTCLTTWHLHCLSLRPQTFDSIRDWNCPDCSHLVIDVPPPPAVKSVVAGADDTSCDLVAAIRAIEEDESLTEREKARKRQAIVGGISLPSDLNKKGKTAVDDNVLDSSFSCSFCMQLLERPVTVRLFFYGYSIHCFSYIRLHRFCTRIVFLPHVSAHRIWFLVSEHFRFDSNFHFKCVDLFDYSDFSIQSRNSIFNLTILHFCFYVALIYVYLLFG